MYRKAGIVVGIFFILLAVGLYWLKGAFHKGEGVTTTPSPSFDSSVDSSREDNNITSEDVPEPEPDTSPEIIELVEPDLSPLIPEGTPTFREIGDGVLGQPSSTQEEIMVIAKKKVVLMDGNYGFTDSKQLVYAIDLIGNSNDNRITVYLNGVSYDSLTVGERLRVNYSIYTNDLGVKFPLVISVEKTD